MSTAPAGTIPDDDGLPAGGPAGAGPDRRTGDDLLGAAADGLTLSPREQQDLLDYFLTNGGLPGDDESRPVEWSVGDGASARKNVWMVKTISWDEWKDAVERTTDEKTAERDTYATASYIVARALVTPQLGPIVHRQQEQAKGEADKKIAGPGGSRLDPPEDAAVLLQRMFAKQSGVLFALSAEVLRLSKLQEDSGSVRTLDQEVEAGKA